MAVKKCKVTGCTKTEQHKTDGMCKAHFTQAKREAGEPSHRGSSPIAGALKVIKHVEEAAKAQVEEVLDHGSIASVTDASGRRVALSVDELLCLALDDAFDDVKRSCLVKLSGLKPGAAIVMAARFVENVRGLSV